MRVRPWFADWYPPAVLFGAIFMIRWTAHHDGGRASIETVLLAALFLLGCAWGEITHNRRHHPDP
jgi:hypothetical protein